MYKNVLIATSIITIGIGMMSFGNGEGETTSALPKGVKYIEPSYMNTTVSPGDNFYEYANGKWLAENPVPSTETRWGSFNILNDYTQNVLKKLIEEAAANPGAKGSPSQMVGDIYASGMDSVTIENLGIKPILPYLERINKIKNTDDLIKEISTQQQELGNPIFGFYVGPDDKNVNKQIINLFQGGLGLPDRDYYFKKDERTENIRKEYAKHIANMFVLAGFNEQEAMTKATNIIALETKLAEASMTRVEMRDPEKLYNKMNAATFKKQTGFDIKKYFQLVGIANEDSLIVGQPKFFEVLNNLLKTENIEVWKSKIYFSNLKGASAYLSKKFSEESFNFSGRILRGQKEQKPRWKRMANLVDGAVGEQLGKIYVDKFFTREAKARMIEMVNNLQDVYRERIQKLDWMSAETKAKAVEKLNTFVKKIGFPDKWRDYTGLVIKRNDLIGNIIASNKFDYKYMIEKLGKPVDKTEWGMSPQTINAYYNPAYNEIVFPAGILQYPFFDFNADDAVIYGGIGAVIGHEMTHGFDDQGAQYASDGNLKDWWTEEDKAKFKTKTDAIVKQYNDYVVLDTMHVNGELTQGENIADLGGVTIAYEAFTRTKQFKEAKNIDGFTPAQRFFLSWAQIWRANTTPQEQATRIMTDPHSPGVHRCNGPLTNFKPFFEAFNIKPGQKMYKSDKEILAVW